MDIPLVISLSSRHRPFACTRTRFAFSKALLTCSVEFWALALVLVVLNSSICVVFLIIKCHCELSVPAVSLSIGKSRKFEEICFFLPVLSLTFFLFSAFQTVWKLAGSVQSRELIARTPRLPGFILLVSFSDTYLWFRF